MVVLGQRATGHPTPERRDRVRISTVERNVVHTQAHTARSYSDRTASAREYHRSLPRLLRTHKALQAKERLAAGAKWVDTGYIFTTEIGTPIEPDNLWREGRVLAAGDGGAGEMRFHDLRHSCVTLLLRLGVPLHIVQAIVGHADVQVTMAVYAHASLEDQRKALEQLEEMVAG